jgi:hypothetical protein
MIRWQRALLAGAVLTMSVAAAHATNLRGMVSSQVSNGVSFSQIGRPGVTVILAVATPAGPRPLSQTITDMGGFYFFVGIRPGQYVLVVGPYQYPISVSPMPAQDIPPVLVP